VAVCVQASVRGRWHALEAGVHSGKGVTCDRVYIKLPVRGYIFGGQD
jgi:hypothetical protein